MGHFFKGPNPLHPAVWEGRLAQLTFRRFQPADVSQCLEIYKLNEPGRFPEGVLSEYEKFLREQSSYFLVAERNGQIVATSGLSYFRRPCFAVLCFGLVGPSDQNAGIGTASLRARLALLKKDEPVYRVFIFAVEKSFGFYERFGFGYFGGWKDIRGQEHPSGSLLISYEEAQKCRQLLADHGISVPHDEDQVPMREAEEK